MNRFGTILVLAAFGLPIGPVQAQMDWLTPHLDAQRWNNLLRHQQEMTTPNENGATAEPTTPAAPRVIDRGFVVILVGPNGDYTVTEDTTVPLLPRQGCWQWGIRLADVPDTIEVVETLTLPEPAGTWEAHPTTVYSDDGRTATSRMTLAPQDGWIEKAWCVGEGDPAGPHSIVVKMDDIVLAEFPFEVEAVE